jgi:AmmeMemoRadiSam system protein B
MKRSPAVAGQFYHGSAERLTTQVQQYITRVAEREKVIGALSPHAGLMYSGYVAGSVYSSIVFPDTFILIGPNHTGLGPRLSLAPSGEWEIPTAKLSIDEDLAAAISEELPALSCDSQAHEFEHSIEVQLPFIAYFSRNVRIVPIAVMSISLQDCKTVGEGIAKAVMQSSRSVVIVASSDMSHYVSDKVARTLDNLALHEMIDLNPEGLFTTVVGKRISMCGYIPATIMLYAAKKLGAGEARLVKYATSGDVSGDFSHVVGYAGVLIK